MKLEQQVVSLELSKRLNELTRKGRCQFFWWKRAGGEWELITLHQKIQYQKLRWCQEFMRAYTVAELGEMLQKYDAKFDLVTHMMQMDMANTEQQFWVSIPEHENRTKIIEKTEADARAKMLIYLLENGLITLT